MCLAHFGCFYRTIYNFMTRVTAAQLESTIPGRICWETYRYSFAFLNEDDLGFGARVKHTHGFLSTGFAKGSSLKLLCWLQLCGRCHSHSVNRVARRPGRSDRQPCDAPTDCVSGCPVAAVVSLTACALFIDLFSVPGTSSSWARILQFAQEVSGGTLTHRTAIWVAGLDAFRDHAFLGVGAGAYGPAVLRVVDIAYPAHNTFLSVLVELGVCWRHAPVCVAGECSLLCLRAGYLERCLWITSC